MHVAALQTKRLLNATRESLTSKRFPIVHNDVFEMVRDGLKNDLRECWKGLKVFYKPLWQRTILGYGTPLRPPKLAHIENLTGLSHALAVVWWKSRSSFCSPPFEHDIECQCKCQPQTEAKVDDDDASMIIMMCLLLGQPRINQIQWIFPFSHSTTWRKQWQRKHNNAKRILKKNLLL